MWNEYPLQVRREARRLWLTGVFTDEEVAAKLGIPRADTIRDWRHDEGWVEIARTISGVIEEQVKVRVREQLGTFRTKYDQLGQAIEARAVRALSNPSLSTRDLKSIAGTLVQTQRIRYQALGGEKGEAPSLADQWAALFDRSREKRRGRPLGRCVGDGVIEDDPASPPTEEPEA